MRIASIVQSILLALLLIAVPLGSLADQRTHHFHGYQGRTKPGRVKYWSPDHKLQAIVIYLKPREENELVESKLEIRNADGKLLAHASYVSSDGSHGGIIRAASWTVDSRFFVYGMASSGGHVPSQHPLRFYSRTKHKLYSLDYTLHRLLSKKGKAEVIGYGYIRSDPHLYKPCILKTTGWVNVAVTGVKVQTVPTPIEEGLPENKLTINLGKLENILTKEDEDKRNKTGVR